MQMELPPQFPSGCHVFKFRSEVKHGESNGVPNGPNVCYPALHVPASG